MINATEDAQGLHVIAAKAILIDMDLTTEDRRPSQDTVRLTPRERLERFVALQRRAMQLLAALPDGCRRYWERNLRQRSIHAKY
jgi:hypothetical protein